MVKSIAIVHTDFRLYWPSRLNALHDYLKKKGIGFIVVEVSGKGSPYSFDSTSHEKGLDWVQLFADKAIEDIPPDVACIAVINKLQELEPDMVLSGAIAFPSGAGAVRWCMDNGKPVIVFDNARLEDVPRARHVDWIKKQVYSHVDAMVIPAPSHMASFEYFGFSSQQLFFGINCVDNDFFSGKTAERSSRPESLPGGEPYFLAIGRQVPKKNWLALLEAFKAVAETPVCRKWHLLFIGEGPEHRRLLDSAGSLVNSRVHFLPFKSQQELPAYYGSAGALVLPSLYGETWGLVVNEAMASGLPVLVSKKCGCADTLVEEGVNGYVFDPDDQADIEGILLKFAGLMPEKRTEMGKASKALVADWGLERFCDGMWQAATFASSRKKRKGSLAGRIILQFWKGRYRPT